MDCVCIDAVFSNGEITTPGSSSQDINIPFFLRNGLAKQHGIPNRHHRVLVCDWHGRLEVRGTIIRHAIGADALHTQIGEGLDNLQMHTLGQHTTVDILQCYRGRGEGCNRCLFM